MVHDVDEALRAEAKRFRLAFACPDCAQFDPERTQCSLGYPVAPHLRADLEGRAEVIFCKAFELW
jgi:hypothetical protein